MKRLILKSLLLATASLLLFVGLCRGLTVLKHWRRSGNDASAVYVWGDSRTYQALDQQRMRDLLKRRVINYSAHGAGPYDFCVFAELVPAGATCILGASQAVAARPCDLDFCGTGWSTNGLYQLWKHNYSWPEIRRVILRSRRPQTIDETPRTYTDAAPVENLDELRQLYDHTIPRYADKLALYRAGLDLLRDKHCKILLVDFPVGPIFRAYLETTQHRNFAATVTKLAKEYDAKAMVNIQLPGTDLWHDHNHLNSDGRRVMTDKVLSVAFGHNPELPENATSDATR